MKKANKIKNVIIVWFTLLISIMMIIQIIANLFLSEQIFLLDRKSRLKQLFYEVKDSYSTETDDLYDITKKPDEISNIQIVITDEQDKIIFNNRTIPPEMSKTLSHDLHENGDATQSKTNKNSIPISKDKYSSEPAIYQFKGKDNSMELMMLTGIINYNNSNVYVTFFSQVESISIASNLFTLINVIISLIILIISIIVLIFFAKKISTPIQKCCDVAEKIAQMDFTVKADEDYSLTEINQMAKSINIISDKMNTAVDNLNRANQYLSDDIEKQKSMEKMHREFISNVSHEMKTPLCLLMMYTDGLKNNINSVDKDFYCDTIIEESAKLDSMVKSLLEISSVSSGLLKMNLVKINLSTLCHKVIKSMNIVFDEYELTTDIKENIFVMADEYYFEQVISNYLRNAVSHTKEHNRISVKLFEQNSDTIFSVFNQGENIKPDDIDNIWDEFYMGNKSRTKDAENHSGLGLYIVKTICNAHNAKYKVENQNNGVEFSVHIEAIKT